jgi:hypothetical protein
MLPRKLGGPHERPLPQTRTLVDFAPYLSFPEPRLRAPIRVKSGSGYPVGGGLATDWQVTMTALPDAPVTVPAGSFQASFRGWPRSRITP